MFAPSDPAFSRAYQFDSTALFRYSALTFNGHRIHYDADYCRTVEGYPNIVIHGPLVATLLLDLCLANGYPPERFTYRATSPIFLPERFSVNGEIQADSLKLWAADHEGGLAMEATASRTGAAR